MTEDKKADGSPKEGEGISRLTLYSLAAAAAAIAGFLSMTLAERLAPTRAPEFSTQGRTNPPQNETSASTGLDKLVRLGAPKTLPDISFSDESGGAHALTEWRGKVVLVNLWATWCAPCKMEMPSLDKLQAKLGGAEFAVLPISLDRTGSDKPRQFLAANNLKNLGLFLDTKNTLIQALQVPGLPLSVLLDREGREIARLAGPAEWDSAQAESLIRETISAKGGS